MKQKIVLATGNKGKVKEMADVLADFGFEVIAQTDTPYRKKDKSE